MRWKQFISCLLPFVFPAVLAAQGGGALMAAASANNGLLLPDAQPWHLRASYQTFDEAGKPAEQGTFEEYWVNPKKDRVSYTGSFNQTDYLLESGHLRTGTQHWAGLAEQLVRHGLVHPMPNPSAVAQAVYGEEDRHIGAEAFRCVTVSLPAGEGDAEPLPSRPVYCFDRDTAKPVLRFEASAGDEYETHFDNPALFAGHSVARDIRTTRAGKPFLVVHVETLEPLPAGSDALFEPPPDAVKPPPQRVRISSSLAQAYLVQGVAPDYPLLAEHAGIQGTVVLHVLVGADGRVLECSVVSAPSKDLGTAAVDAVRRWTYRPYRLNGEALEMVTEVRMQFHIPKR